MFFYELNAFTVRRAYPVTVCQVSLSFAFFAHEGVRYILKRDAMCGAQMPERLFDRNIQ